MTVCIATIYGKNKGVVAVADKMFTSAPGILTVHEVNENNKITRLNDTAVAMMAGNVVNASAIITELIGVIDKGDTLAEIANKAADIYRQHYKNAVNAELSRWGMDLETFNQNQQILEQGLVAKINGIIGSSSLDVEMIIAGKDANGPGLYIVGNPGVVNCLDSIGRAIIGSGGAHASLSMVDSESQKSDALGRTLFTSFKAKKKAEYDPNVGKYTSVCVIDGKVKEFTNEEIKQLNTLYEEAEEQTGVILNNISTKVGEVYNGSTSTKAKR